MGARLCLRCRRLRDKRPTSGKGGQKWGTLVFNLSLIKANCAVGALAPTSRGGRRRPPLHGLYGKVLIVGTVLGSYGLGRYETGFVPQNTPTEGEFMFLKDWPLLRQITGGLRGTGPEVMSERTRNLKMKTAGAEVARSICPYCGVGCGQLVFHKGNKLISIEGDPESPISRGRLCPKGADTFELHTHSQRLKKVKYRAPYAKEWREIELERAMDMVADRLWDSRERTFEEKRDGQMLMQTTAVGHLGGATLDIEENYLIKKLFSVGLGMVCISNQARI